MGRLTPFGSLVLLILLVAVVGGLLAMTDNLRWPPFGITLAAPTPIVVTATPNPSNPPAATSVALVPTNPPAAPNITAAPTAPPPTATSTPTATPTATSTPTPTPPGLAYVGAIDVPGLDAGPGGPQPAATDPETHRLYVMTTNGAGRGILGVYDETNLQKQKDIPLDLEGMTLNTVAPVPVLVHGPTKRIYVVAPNGRIAVIDSNALAETRSFNLGQPIDHAFLNPDGTKLYGLLSDQPGSGGPLLRMLDLQKVTTKGIKIPSGWAADSAFVDGTTLYLTGREGLLPMDMRYDIFGGPIQLGFEPLFPLFDGSARRLFAWRQPQTVPLVPEMVVLDAGNWQVSAKLTHDGCPCLLAYGGGRQRVYLAVPQSPGRVLAYSLGDKLATHDDLVLNTVPALNILPSASAPRLYVQSSGPHAILVLQDNGPAPGRQPTVVDVTR
ncbi:MAG TPA: hypothetical protein VFM49_13835 [Chloroflexia bacterium]|nr:hypothetical protein [Chloroflexia bacterium]